MMNVRDRVSQLTTDDLNGLLENARRKILWAGGLKDLPNDVPDQGYTGHLFNDFNHVDLTCMLDQVAENENNGEVKGIAIDTGGSWSTYAMGCNKDPPQDVAHVQFQARIAFKLVWVS
jgi:hypothetical protein